MKSVLIYDLSNLLQFVFDLFWRWFLSDKHLFNLEKHPYFFVLMSRFSSSYVPFDLVLWYLVVLDLLKVLFMLSSSRQLFIKINVWSVKKSFSVSIFSLFISFNTEALLGINFVFLIGFSCSFSIFFNSVHCYCPHTWHL